jgi:glycosyltransferase involved in cell wall biosynthesis
MLMAFNYRPTEWRTSFVFNLVRIPVQAQKDCAHLTNREDFVMSLGISRRWRVGIDLGPAGGRAPGTARHVAEQARALFKLDVPWTWVPLVEGKSNPLYEELVAQDLKPVVIPSRKVWTRVTFQIGPALAENKCDLGFTTGFVPWHSCKVVVNSFDSNIFEYGWTWIQSGRRWNYYLNRTLGMYSLWRAKRLFVNSQYCVDYLRKRFPFTSSKLCVIPPGILPAVEPSQESRPAALEKMSKPYCLYVGIFSENKNQRRLIEAWAQWQKDDPEAPALVLVGRSDGDYFDSAILPALKNASRPDEIIFAKDLSEGELAWCYRHAALYVQPSFAEGFGLPIVEAMRYGLPVAASRTTSLPEAGGDAAVYFDPSNITSMLGVIGDLWGDGEKRRLLAQRAEKRPGLFTWEKNARAVAAEMEAVLAGKQPD